MAASRLLAIDYGSKRIGAAISDADGKFVSPLKMIPAGRGLNDDVAAILSVAAEYDAGEFIVGLPLNMDGTEGDQAKLCRQLGDFLAKQSGKTVHFVDERLSSFSAEEKLQGADWTRRQKRARLDSIAAQHILQHYLDSVREGQKKASPE